jgi:predicted Zn-dependent peptidase
MLGIRSRGPLVPALLLSILVIGPLTGPSTHLAAAPQGAGRVTFTDTKLDNGLRVIISEDHSAPVFSIAVTYNVGSRDERKGRTGFAHLFEHMMFKGSEQVGPGEHFTLIFNNGGSMNGTTNQDRTLYYETLPANQLDLALFLEADRMWSLDVTKENLENQINAVQEERRLGVDNRPYGRTFERLGELAYSNFAYSHSVIGSMADLSAATVDDVKAFFRTYYAPNNAVVSIVGDVDTKDTLAKVRKYFGRIPSQPAPAEVDMTEPPQKAEQRETLEDPLARLPRVDIAWHQPPANTPDDDALTVLASILSGGRSSRFYDSLVRQQQLTSGASASAAGTRGPGLFQIGATALPGKSIAELEKAIYAELDKIKAGPIEDWEIEKARNAQKRQFVSGLGSSLQRAVLLGQYALFYDDPNLINTFVDRLSKVTVADVQRVAKQYLVAENRTVLVTLPKAAQQGGR